MLATISNPVGVYPTPVYMHGPDYLLFYNVSELKNREERSNQFFDTDLTGGSSLYDDDGQDDLYDKVSFRGALPGQRGGGGAALLAKWLKVPPRHRPDGRVIVI